MINAGFNPLEEMSRKTGKSVGQLKEEMSKGTITAKMMQDAFMSATQEGGKFFGMSESGAKTIEGQLSKLEDAWSEVYNTIGQNMEGIFSGALGVTTKLVENWTALIPVILGVAAAFGVTKVAEMTATAVEEIHNLEKEKGVALTWKQAASETARSSALDFATIKTGLAYKAQLLYNSAMAACPYVALALGLAGVVTLFASWYNMNKQFRDSQDRVNSLMSDAVVAANKEKAELQNLCEAYKEASEGADGSAKSEENLTTAKNNLIALATKYNVTLKEEQLKVENLAQTYELLAKNIELSNKAKVVDTLKEEGKKGVESAQANTIQQAQDRFKDKVYEDFDLDTEEGQNEYAKALQQYAKGTTAMNALFEAIKKNEIEFDSSDFNGLTTNIADGFTTKEFYAQWDSLMAKVSEKIGSENAAAINEMVKVTQEHSFWELYDNQSYREVVDGLKAAAAEQVKARAAEDLMKNDAELTSYLAGLEMDKKLAEWEASYEADRQKHDLKEIVKRIQDADKKIKELHKKMASGKFSDNDLKELADTEAKRKTAAEEYKKATGKDYSSKTKDSAKKTKEAEKSIEEQLYQLRKQEQNLEKSTLEFQKGQTKSLKERKKLEEQILDIERTQALEDLEHQRKKAIADIDKREDLNKSDKDKLKKKTNELYYGKTDKDDKHINGLFDIKRAEYDQKAQQQNLSYLKEVEEQQKALVQSYGTYTDKKKALDKEWAEEYAKLIDAGFDRRSAEVQKALDQYSEKGRELAKSYTYSPDEWKEQKDTEDSLARMVSRYSLEGFDVMREQIGNFVNQIGGDIAEIDMQIYNANLAGDTAKVAELEKQKEQALKAQNVAKEQQLEIEKQAYEQESIAAQLYDEQIEQAKTNADIIQADLDAIQAKIDKAKAQGKDAGEVAKLEKQRAELQAKQAANSKNLASLEKKRNQTANRTQQQIEKQNKKLEKQKKAVGLVGDAFSLLGDNINGVAKDVAYLVSDISGAVISTIDSMQQYNQAVLAAEDAAAKGTAESVSTVEKASVILAVISAVVQVATKIASMFSKGNDTSDEVARYKEVAGIYAEMADAKAAEVDNARTSQQARKATEEQIALYGKETDAYKESIRQRMKHREKHEHSIGYKTNKQLQSKEWQSAFSAEGLSVQNWNDLMNLSAEELKKFRENHAYLWSTLDDETKSSLENIIALEKQEQEAAEKLKETYAGITLDGLKDSATELFLNMDKNATDFTDGLKQNLRESIINSIVENEFAQELKGLQENLEKAGEDGVDPDEAARLMEQAKETQEKINQRKLELAEQYGESGIFQDEDDNTITTGTFAEMSEATANALEARFTAVYESNLRIESSISGLSGTLAGTQNSILGVSSEMALSISADAKARAASAAESLKMQAESLLELKAINENGSSIIRQLKGMAADLYEVRQSTSKL